MFFNTFFTALLLATATIAAPVIVFSPHIISPQAAVAWPMGSQQTVKWGERSTQNLFCFKIINLVQTQRNG